MAETAAGVSANEKESYLRTAEREFATTLKVMRSYPTARAELQPHEKCKTARELSWIFTLESGACMAAMTDSLKMPPDLPPAPASMDECITEFEKVSGALLELVRNTPADALSGTVEFMVGPGQMGQIPKMQFLWFMLHDQIHHRGQLSIYLRMADGRVPSIYGPSADEPWF